MKGPKIISEGHILQQDFTKRLKIPARGWLITGLTDESLRRFSTKFLWKNEQIMAKSSPL